MTDRIARMKDRLKVDRYPICAEKARYVIEAWRQHEGLPSILQRAYATANYLDKRTLYIDDDELIVGNVASRPMGMEASTWGPFWDDEDLDGMVGEGGKFSITPEDRAELRRAIARAAETLPGKCYCVVTFDSPAFNPN